MLNSHVENHHQLGIKLLKTDLKTKKENSNGKLRKLTVHFFQFIDKFAEVEPGLKRGRHHGVGQAGV